jgi:hypothetical protein
MMHGYTIRSQEPVRLIVVTAPVREGKVVAGEAS